VGDDRIVDRCYPRGVVGRTAPDKLGHRCSFALRAARSTARFAPAAAGASARAYCRRFFAWYNAEHRHSGIALLTPEDVHLGRVDQRRQARSDVLQAAYARNPNRFVNGTPEPPALEPTVFINQPETIAA